MGCRFHLTCPACGYCAEVSGGADGGLVSATETVRCLSCRELYDVIVSARAADNDAKPWIEQPRCCPKDEGHRLEAWTLPGPCPRCERPITDENAQVAALWD